MSLAQKQMYPLRHSTLPRNNDSWMALRMWPSSQRLPHQVFHCKVTVASKISAGVFTSPSNCRGALIVPSSNLGAHIAPTRYLLFKCAQFQHWKYHLNLKNPMIMSYSQQSSCKFLGIWFSKPFSIFVQNIQEVLYLSLIHFINQDFCCIIR